MKLRVHSKIKTKTYAGKLKKLCVVCKDGTAQRKHSRFPFSRHGFESRATKLLSGRQKEDHAIKPQTHKAVLHLLLY